MITASSFAIAPSSPIWPSEKSSCSSSTSSTKVISFLYANLRIATTVLLYTGFSTGLFSIGLNPNKTPTSSRAFIKASFVAPFSSIWATTIFVNGDIFTVTSGIVGEAKAAECSTKSCSHILIEPVGLFIRPVVPQVTFTTTTPSYLISNS